LITGGEPGEQHVPPLVEAFRTYQYPLSVACETSGTTTGVVPDVEASSWDYLTLSPKLTIPNPPHVYPEIFALADEVKFPIGRRTDVDKALKFYDRMVKTTLHHPVISFQPLSKSRIATMVCIDAAKQHGANLSIQIHQYLGIK
jgi:organic radical activating enzyme